MYISIWISCITVPHSSHLVSVLERRTCARTRSLSNRRISNRRTLSTHTLTRERREHEWRPSRLLENGPIRALARAQPVEVLHLTAESGLVSTLICFSSVVQRVV